MGSDYTATIALIEKDGECRLASDIGIGHWEIRGWKVVKWFVNNAQANDYCEENDIHLTRL